MEMGLNDNSLKYGLSLIPYHHAEEEEKGRSNLAIFPFPTTWVVRNEERASKNVFWS
jgi:hypothetical protein